MTDHGRQAYRRARRRRLLREGGLVLLILSTVALIGYLWGMQ